MRTCPGMLVWCGARGFALFEVQPSVELTVLVSLGSTGASCACTGWVPHLRLGLENHHWLGARLAPSRPVGHVARACAPILCTHVAVLWWGGQVACARTHAASLHHCGLGCL